MQGGIKMYTKTTKKLPILNYLRRKKVRQFLAMVQDYCYLWPKRSEILALLKELTKGVPTKMASSNGLQLSPIHLNKQKDSFPGKQSSLIWI